MSQYRWNSRGTLQSGLCRGRRACACALLLLLAVCLGATGCVAPWPASATSARPTITSFVATPASITAGGSTTLSWVTSGATSLTVTPGAYTSASADGALTVSPTATTTYTLIATNAAGFVSTTVTVTVTQPSAPSIQSFTASPTGISAGGSSTLSWATTGATSISISPGAFTSNLASGTTSVSPSSTTTYTLTATNAAGFVTATATVTVQAASAPTILSFTAYPTSITAGASAMLSWYTSGATSISISPGSFTSASANGSTTVTPTTTTTYTLTATNAAGHNTATATVTVTASSGTLKISTTSCPAGTQGMGYTGCTILASGGTPPYTFSVSSSASYPTLPEGLSLNAASGLITSTLIGGQGTYQPQIIVTDSLGAQANAVVSFAITGSNAYLASIFPSNSIFHHRVDAATTGLPVDTSPAAPMYSGYLAATVKPFFGNTNNPPFPNGIPAIEVPWDQPNVAVSTTMYQHYFTSGPIPAYAPPEGTANNVGGDMHVLVYRQAGAGNPPALYEMWQGIFLNGPWTDSSNALWPDVTTNNLTTQGNGTSDAAGLPIAPLVVNADEVIGTGTPTQPNGVVQHPIRFTLNHMLNYWVWPGTETAGTGSCSTASGAIPTGNEISQSSPPVSCSMSGPAGEIYRLKASVATPACAATSPQAAILITAFRNYGIILADNGISGGLIGTPDARWNDNDLNCITSLILNDFEPVNVSSLMVSNASGQTSH